jgi:hypothetical protein
MSGGTQSAQPAETAIRTEVRVGDPGSCPVAQASSEADATVHSVVRSAPREDGTVTEDFTVEGEDGLSAEAGAEIYSSGAQHTYRFDRHPDGDCVCESVEELGLPLADIHAQDGKLFLTFYAAEIDQVKEIIGLLREQFGGVHVQRLSRSGGATDRELVLVDRSRLTDRQREVIETAHNMGYFNYPREANASEIAAELGIAPSTFSEHLAAAQAKIMEAVVEG